MTLEQLARKELLKHKKGSATWMYWRGITLGLESARCEKQMLRWAKRVARQAKS